MKMPSKSGYRFKLCFCFLFIAFCGDTVGLFLFWLFDCTLCEYGVIVDGGSMHTAVYVYKWDAEKYNMPSQIASKRLDRGISSFNGDLQGLKSFLEELLDFSAKIIPGDKQTVSPVYIGATGGMRNLRAKNRTASEEILTVIRETTQKYQFHFFNETKQVRILSGVEEGLYSWATSNYLARELKAKEGQSNDFREDTVGALDLGGSSTQIAFYPGNSVIIPQNYGRNIMIYGSVVDLYSESYNCYGVDEVLRMYKALLVMNQNYSLHIKSPCGHIGFSSNESYSDIFELPCTREVSSNHNLLKNKIFLFEGSGNILQCQAIVRQLFDFIHCDYSHCGFNGEYQPLLQGKYYAFSNFYFEMEFLRDNVHLNFNNYKTTLPDFTKKVKTLCVKEWTEVKEMKTYLPEALPFYCFGGQYIYTLLTKGYKFNESTWTNISFINQINGKDIGWALGYMVEVTVNDPVTQPVSVFKLTFSILLVFIGIACFGIVCLARKHKHATDLLVNTEYRSYGTAGNSQA